MSHYHRPSRRDFLKTAAAGAAVSAIGFPTIISSRALGADATTAPSEKLTLGFIGIGKQSSGHLNSFLGKPAVQVVAVCDVYKPRLDLAKETTEKRYAQLERKGFKGCEAYGDYRELLARKDIDAVVIGTPDHWHTIPVIEAAKAGKHIYCEKPLTLTIHEAKTVVDCMDKHKITFQTGSQQRSSGPFRQACELIRNGRLGKIKEVYIMIGKTSQPCDLPGEPIPEGLNWEMWQGQAPAREYNDILCRHALPNAYPFNPGWRDYREYSGGYVTDWGAHHYDITQWALGMDDSGPTQVVPPGSDAEKGFGVKIIYDKTPVGDGIVVTHKSSAEYKNGQTGKTEKEGNGLLFIGEKGRLFVNRGKITSDPAEILDEPLKDKKVDLYVSKDHHQNWLDCIKSGKKTICPAEVGARSVTVCHLANLGYWHGKQLQWDPKAWQFTGENAEEANKWRDRERRDPYQLPAI